MNKTAPSQGGFAITATIIVGLILTIFPFPDWADNYRPPWTTLILIYWAMALPHKFGITAAWITGLSIDIITGGLLGQHALSLSIVAFLVLQLHLRLRLFPMWQQSVAILVLLMVERVFNLWITSIAYGPQFELEYFLPPVVGMLLWPWFYVILRDIRRRFKIN